jgi:hypothetical protein
MNKATVLSQRSLRRDQVLEIHFSPLPEPPPEMMKLPGVRAWFEQMKLMRDRDIQSFHRLVNNLQISSNNAGPE